MNPEWEYKRLICDEDNGKRIFDLLDQISQLTGRMGNVMDAEMLIKGI